MPALAHSTAYRGLSSMSTVAPISLQEVRHPSVPGQLSVRPCFSITYSDFTHSALSAAVLGHSPGKSSPQQMLRVSPISPGGGAVLLSLSLHFPLSAVRRPHGSLEIVPNAYGCIRPYSKYAGCAAIVRECKCKGCTYRSLTWPWIRPPEPSDCQSAPP